MRHRSSPSSTRSGLARTTPRRIFSSNGSRFRIEGARNMIQRGNTRVSLRALVVDDELGNPTAEGRAIRSLVQELQGRNIEVVEAASAEDGTSVVTSDSAIHAVLIDW